MTRSRFIKLLIIFFIFFSPALYAENIIWKETTIPMAAAGSQGLETLLVWPDSRGKHPLALISHGSPRNAKERSQMTAISFLPVAMEFARRGFAVAVVLRRGYGTSGGGWAENYGDCNATNYMKAAEASAADLHAAIDYLGTLPQFDIDRMIAVGVSAGGFATVALTAKSPPQGLVAAISFAGGRGSTAHDSVCQEEALDSTFAILGKTSRTPMLWIYSENDHFFNPKTAEKFLKAFNSNGGHATFIQAPAFEDDGHRLFSAAGISAWTPMVEDFLKQHQLVLREKLLPLPPVTKLQAPAKLSIKNKKIFTTYLASPEHKAFAVSPNGAFGWRSGRRTVGEAKAQALALCEQYVGKNCKLYAVDNQIQKM